MFTLGRLDMSNMFNDVLGWAILAAVMGLCFGVFGTIGGAIGNWVLVSYHSHRKRVHHWQPRIWGK
jgi:hypothetical protein